MARERAASRRAPPFIDPPGYAQHRPEATLLYQLVEQYYPALLAVREAAGRPLPGYVQEEFEAYLKCGRLEHGFLRVRCDACHAEKLVAFSCKRRGFCPSCGARRMVESAALLVDEVLPQKPLRQWVLSLPFALRFLLATRPQALTLTLTAQGHVRYRLKTPYRDGTTHVVFEPLDFLARLAALVPPPRVHLTRYHGAFAPHAALRAAITLAGRGRGARHREVAERALLPHVAMSWMQRLKRVFAIEIERCRRCGGRLEVIASIEDLALIERILAHVRQRAEDDVSQLPLGARAPPPPSLF